MPGPKEVIDGNHPGHRTLHAKGILCRGTFTATAEASRLSRAAHLQGEPVEVTVRFSNGSGNPRHPDYAPDVRGMAVKFYLPDGSRTDIVAQSAVRFPVKSVAAFVEMVEATTPGPMSLVRLPWFLARHPRAGPALLANVPTLRPPASYAAVTYLAIHTYWWAGPDGQRTAVRYTLDPHIDEPPPSPQDAKARGRDYLQDDLRTRLADGPLHYDLRVQIAEPGDDVDDPRSVWPAARRTLTAGTLTITGLDTQRETGDDVLVFDPVRVTDGIELSDDPILRARPTHYSESIARRMR
jgi:catalase